jgi:hypothetical protein
LGQNKCQACARALPLDSFSSVSLSLASAEWHRMNEMYTCIERSKMQYDYVGHLLQIRQ